MEPGEDIRIVPGEPMSYNNLTPTVVAETVHLPLDATLWSLYDSDPDGQIAAGYFKSALWSKDGTTIVTNSEDNTIRSYILPTDVLSGGTHSMDPFLSIETPGPVYSVTLFPFYNLSQTNTTIFLTSTRDHPIQLRNTILPGLLASYPLINQTTEAYITPHSMLFTDNGTQFITGSDSLLACFDLNRPGCGPQRLYPTIPSKHKKIVGGGVGMKGIISSLGVNCDGVLAAGTFTGHIGLYDQEGRGVDIGTFSVDKDEHGNKILGSGITQTEWSPDGRYLYIAERMSKGILMFDMRMNRKSIGVLRGRKAMTNQRMAIDVKQTEKGHKVVAGNTDGTVVVWENPERMVNGACFPDYVFQAHDDVVGSALFYPGPLDMVATCSGSREGQERCYEKEESDEDNGDRSKDEKSGEKQAGSGTNAGERPRPHATDFSLKVWMAED